MPEIRNLTVWLPDTGRRQRIAATEQRAEAAEHSREAEAHREVTAERIRIAHELHDVLAHRIAGVNAQAGSGLTNERLCDGLRTSLNMMS